MGKLLVADAAEMAGVSYRQMQRIVARYRVGGEAALGHRSRGRSSSRRIDTAERERIVARCREQYGDCGPTYARERLLMEGLRVPSVEALRKWLKAAGMGKDWCRTGRPVHRQWRQRMECEGALAQFDGSWHRWCGEQRAKCCLMATIDDATGEITALFCEYEGTAAAMLVLWDHVEQCGIPLRLYTDHKNCYGEQPAQSIEEQLAGEVHHTHFTRACADLGIEIINANSPQAKGRVERLFRTLQDRLIKDMRYAGITTIEAANRYLREEWLPRYNRGVRAKQTRVIASVACPLPDDVQLEHIFSYRYTRCVNNDFTISYKTRRLQLLPAARTAAGASHPRRIRPRQRVEVREWLDGSLHIVHDGHEVPWKPVDTHISTPKKEQRLDAHTTQPIRH